LRAYRLQVAGYRLRVTGNRLAAGGRAPSRPGTLIDRPLREPRRTARDGRVSSANRKALFGPVHHRENRAFLVFRLGSFAAGCKGNRKGARYEGHEVSQAKQPCKAEHPIASGLQIMRTGMLLWEPESARESQASAEVGSMMNLTSETRLAGKPPCFACSRTISSLGAM
jgi:hypothetical protein